MNAWKKWAWAMAGLLTVALIVVVLKFMVIDVLVDWWWFRSQNLEIYFILRKAHRYIVFIFFTIVFTVVFAVNFWIASRFIGFINQKKNGEKRRDLIRLLHRETMRLYRPLSLLMAFPVAITMFQNWEAALMFLFGEASGVTDPVLGKDISFYLFRLPVYHMLQQGVLLVSIILLIGVSFLYWYAHRLLAAEDQALPRGARIHISILGLATVMILCWGILLERFDMLYTATNAPVFFGPGYAEMRVILPFIWLSVIFLMATGIALIYSANRKTGWRFVFIFGLFFVMSFIAKNADFFAQNIRTYIVMPNQMARERNYIEAHMRATLSAFGLDQVKPIEFKPKPVTDFDSTAPDLVRRLQNIPVWDREMLSGIYEEIQGIRTYYTFPAINVDRYGVEDRYRQVYIGAREVDPERLPKSAQTWINIHLQYTHGQGVAMTPAAQAGDEFMTWFIRDVPPRSDYGLTIKQSGIYYGLGGKHYVIAPNDTGEIGHPLAEGDAIVHYDGTGGIPMGSLLKKWFLATYFDDHDIFFTTKTHSRSRLLFRRNIMEQANHITPFFRLDPEPYVVTTQEGIFWIQDAYTTSTHYPLVEQVEEGFNYIRNSVKIVTDAYNGTISYYAADLSDPVLKAYRRMYPGLIKPLESLPAELRQHIRYPRDLFRIQAHVYAKYHPQAPEQFYRQEDFWAISKVPSDQELVPANPYYLTLDLLEPGKQDFLLFVPLSPFGRDNLRALMVAGCDGDNYGKLFVYNFSQEQHVYGPAQVNAVINQDINIAQQFTLWGQRGAEVVLGNMIIEPSQGNLLYIQPVYLRESGPIQIPELKRLIMAVDGAVVMAASLEEAAVKLEAELSRKRLRQQQVFPSPQEVPGLELPGPELLETKAPVPPTSETGTPDPGDMTEPEKETTGP
ncbi:UPF0182 family protein [Desulfosarcina sp. OttesenSCG-928-A07]|nr:UPF0182 family protein [Desulfosarcina sp. OttesenSCG-928-A07]